MMKDFVIKQLSLYNFKGQTRTFMPHDLRTFVRGANGVGKTTLYKSFCWLLTSYTDCINPKNHELYDSRLELTHETPEARVMANIVIDGIEYTIERRAKAKFSRKRGSQEWTKDASDSYKILIDDIETSATDFNDWLERNIGEPNLIPYMLMGEMFANLVLEDKNKARKILEQVTGEITIDMMSGDYSLIKKDLQKYPIEQLLERYKNQLKPLNQRSLTIDSLIESKKQELVDIDHENFNELLTLINQKTKEISDLDKCILNASKSAEPLLCKRETIVKKIHELSVELGDKRWVYEDSMDFELREKKKQIRDLDIANVDIKANNKKLKDEYDYQCSLLYVESKNLSALEKQREKLVERRNEVKSRVFNDEICKYCHQPLPPIELEEAREKFNKQKKEDLESIISEGKVVKEKIDISRKRVIELTEIKEQGYIECELLSKEQLVEEYEELKAKNVPFEETDEYKRIDKEINELKASMPNIAMNYDADLLAKKEKLTDELQELNREYGKKAVFDKVVRDIENYNTEKRNLGSEIARIEGHIATIKEYEEERASIISEKINEKLEDCKVVMYSRQKDGTLKPDCVITNNDGVKYATLNNSARILTCLSLQRMFCKHFGINMPIFVDESAVFDSAHLPRFDAQTIYLFASDDNVLMVE